MKHPVDPLRHLKQFLQLFCVLEYLSLVFLQTSGLCGVFTDWNLIPDQVRLSPLQTATAKKTESSSSYRTELCVSTVQNSVCCVHPAAVALNLNLDPISCPPPNPPPPV